MTTVSVLLFVNGSFGPMDINIIAKVVVTTAAVYPHQTMSPICAKIVLRIDAAAVQIAGIFGTSQLMLNKKLCNSAAAAIVSSRRQ